MTALLLSGLLAFAETPEKTIDAFVAAFNARDAAAISKEVVGGGPAESPMMNAMPKEVRLKAVLGAVEINGNSATVEADVEMTGLRPSGEKPSHETIRLTKTNGNWQIVSTDPQSMGMRETPYISLMAFMVGHPELMLKARTAAKKTTCLSNVKQLSLATLLYTTDHNDVLPKSAASWKSVIMPYVKNKGLFHCPEDTSGHDSYFMDARIAGMAMNHIANPSQTAMVVEGSANKTAFRHAGTASIGYIDGHAKICKPAMVVAARTVKLN